MAEQKGKPHITKTAMALLYVKATPEGKFDFDKSKRLLAEMAAMPASLLDYQIILDVRDVKSVMSVADQWYLAEQLFDYRETLTRKMAVLCPYEQIDNKKFFALCARNRGFMVRAFTSFEEAVEWLIAKEPDI